MPIAYLRSSRFAALCPVGTGNGLEQELRIGGVTNLLQRFRIPELSRRAGQRIKLGVAVRGVREQEQEDNVDRLIVDGVEIDAVMQPGENGKGCLQALKPRVRKGEAVA